MDKTTTENQGTDQPLMMEQKEPQGTSPTPRERYSTNRVIKTLQVVRDLGNEVIILRLKWLIAGMLIFLVSVVLTQAQFNTANEDSRHDDQVQNEAQRQRDNYVYNLVDWNAAVSTQALCIEAVSRSDLNRAQHKLIADRLDQLGDEENAEVLRNGPLLSSKPRQLTDCIDPGPRPVAPDLQAVQEAEKVINPTSTTTGDTTP